MVVGPDGPELEAERIVSLPRIEGRPLRNVPSVDGGFVPVDEFAKVPGLSEHVFAAGDATNLPLKHGGLGAQQADVAAAGIAAMAGADVTAGAVQAGGACGAPHRRRAALHHGSAQG